MKRFAGVFFLFCLTVCFSIQPAFGFEFDYHGSLGKGKHERYVPPLSNPLFNETPYITTEVRPLFIHNVLPGSFLTGGGHINVYALELRMALNDRLGIIASKDGYVDAEFDGVLPDENGFANISLGLKYALWNKPTKNEIITAGFEFELPSGDLDAGAISIQGQGGGLVDLFTSGAKNIGRLGIEGNTGVNLALQDEDTSMWHWAVHFDYALTPKFFPVLEFNGFKTIDDSNRTPVGFEGVDLVNFGAIHSGTVATMGVGFRYQFTNSIQMGAGWESPISGREDIFGKRANVDMVFTF